MIKTKHCFRCKHFKPSYEQKIDEYTSNIYYNIYYCKKLNKILTPYKKWNEAGEHCKYIKH